MQWVANYNIPLADFVSFASEFRVFGAGCLPQAVKVNSLNGEYKTRLMVQLYNTKNKRLNGNNQDIRISKAVTVGHKIRLALVLVYDQCSWSIILWNTCLTYRLFSAEAPNSPPSRRNAH